MHTLPEEEYQQLLKAKERYEKHRLSCMKWQKEQRDKNTPYAQRRREQKRLAMQKLRAKRKEEKLNQQKENDND